MKRLLFMAAAVFALSATPAMAQQIPHNDDDPDHWGAVYNLKLCGQYACQKEATSTDSVTTLVVDEVPQSVPPCDEVTYGFYANLDDINPEIFTIFEGLPAYNCLDITSGLRGCVYSPSGFTNGSADIELWLRDNYWELLGAGRFASTPPGAVGNYVYRFDSFTYDATLSGTAGGQSYTMTTDGTFEIAGDPILVEHDRGASACNFPELS